MRLLVAVVSLLVISLLGTNLPLLLKYDGIVNYTSAQPIEGTWTQIFPSNYPGDKRSSVWAYDRIHNVIVLFGGAPGSGQTWIYDLSTETWAQKFPTVSPGSRWAHAMTFDSKNGVIVLFGGFRFSHSAHLNDTWTYNVATNTWTHLHPANSPSPRHWPAMAFDENDGKVVLFGGHSPYDGAPEEILGDTWILDVAAKSWTQVFPEQSPSPRQTFMIYNQNDGLSYVFGGFKHEYLLGHSSQFFNDMWSYDVSTNVWTKIADPPTSPEIRRTKWTYDYINNVGILFGGDGPFNPLLGRFTVYGDTWAYHFETNTWTEIVTDPSPVPRYMNLILYDHVNHKTLLYGGTEHLPDAFGDFWTFQFTQGTSNQSPLANAGSDQTVDEATVVTLDGTLSSDPDDDPLTYFWTQISGPPVTLSGVNISTPEFLAPTVSSETNLIFRLFVHDGTVSSSPDSVTITVQSVIDETEDPCIGATATITGTEGDDILMGTAGDDVILALGGIDTISGFGGNDIICAGSGDDVVYGGAGSDDVVGGSGNDLLYGTDGDDRIFGNDGADQMYGGPGNDALYGGGGEDVLFGGDNHDQLFGGTDNDIINGMNDSDFLDGAEGDDTLRGGTGDDTCRNGEVVLDCE